MPTTGLHPDDVLLGCLVLAAPPDRIFTGLSAKIHTAFYELRKDPDFADFLEVFQFSDETPYPYSAELARALAHLQRSRLIGMANPDFRRYFIDEEARSIFDDVVARDAFSPESLRRLGEMSRRLWSLLKE